MSLSSSIRVPSVPHGTDFNPISYGILKFNLLWGGGGEGEGAQKPGP